MLPARITLPAVGASVWASGSQVWNGHKGTLMAKAEPKATEDGSGTNLITVGELQINTNQHLVTLGERSIMLKPKEFDLLAFMARHRGQVLTRETLLERVWDYDYSGGTRTVDVHIRWLREKIEADPSPPHYIHTIFGVGYKLDLNGNPPAPAPVEAT